MNDSMKIVLVDSKHVEKNYAIWVSDRDKLLNRISTHVNPEALREWAILSLLPSHDNIVSLDRVDLIDDRIHLRMARFKETLYDAIRDRNIGKRINSYMRQICKALSHMHSHGLIHRDVKPENIMVSKDREHVVLIDFGISRSLNYAMGESDLTEYVVSRYYRAPELICNLPYDEKVDVWSAGCVFYEMATDSLFAESEEPDKHHLLTEIFKRFTKSHPIPKHYNKWSRKCKPKNYPWIDYRALTPDLRRVVNVDHLQSILDIMLVIDETKRASMDDVLKLLDSSHQPPSKLSRYQYLKNHSRKTPIDTKWLNHPNRRLILLWIVETLSTLELDQTFHILHLTMEYLDTLLKPEEYENLDELKLWALASLWTTEVVVSPYYTLTMVEINKILPSVKNLQLVIQDYLKRLWVKLDGQFFKPTLIDFLVELGDYYDEQVCKVAIENSTKFLYSQQPQSFWVEAENLYKEIISDKSHHWDSSIVYKPHPEYQS